ncbi:hypothetical protein [Flavobacterium notoginsengisoli]|uniref:hypothetical protein n=1 Tax=Flavobacterium notoginsengisoli TaxID=1478199 RepID=UPI00362B374C
MERTHKTKYAYASGNNSIEIQNGYFSGYELLHGTKYFSFATRGEKDYETAIRWSQSISVNSADIKNGNFEAGVPIQSSRRGIRR